MKAIPTMNCGRIRITWDLLKEALHMPPETCIMYCKYTPFCLEIEVWHPDLPAISIADEVPFYDPIVTRTPETIEWKWK